MKEVVEIEIEMERDLNKVSVRLLYHLTRSGCSDFSTAAQKGRDRFRSIRPTPPSCPPPPCLPTPPTPPIDPPWVGHNATPNLRWQTGQTPSRIKLPLKNTQNRNGGEKYISVYLARDSKYMRLLWVNFKMGHFRGSAGIFQLNCYQDRL